MTSEDARDRQRLVEWSVGAALLLVALLGQAYLLRRNVGAWPTLLPAVAGLLVFASNLAQRTRPRLARVLIVVSAMLAGAGLFYVIEHWQGALAPPV